MSWNIETSDWTKITLKSASFILDQAEKSIKYSIEVSDKITNRAFALTIILMSGITALIGLLAKEFSKDVYSGTLVIFYIGIIVSAIVALFYLIKISFPRLFMMVGRSPKEIAIPAMLETEFSELSLILNEIENSQRKIDFNDNQNQERITILKKVIIALCTGFVITILLVLISGSRI